MNKHIAVFSNVNKDTEYKDKTRLEHIHICEGKETMIEVYHMIRNDDKNRYEVIKGDGAAIFHSPHYELCLWRLFHIACKINLKNE